MSAATFRAAVVRVPNGPDSIEIIEVPVAEPGPGQIRVAIAAATVNPTDLGVAAGFFHAIGLVQQPEHTGLGWEFAGVVDAAGPGVEPAAGTRVAGGRLRPGLRNLRRADRGRGGRRRPGA